MRSDNKRLLKMPVGLGSDVSRQPERPQHNTIPRGDCGYTGGLRGRRSCCLPTCVVVGITDSYFQQGRHKALPQDHFWQAFLGTCVPAGTNDPSRRGASGQTPTPKPSSRRTVCPLLAGSCTLDNLATEQASHISECGVVWLACGVESPAVVAGL